jgi:hypothetical protein
MINFQVQIESTGEVFEGKVSLDAYTSKFKTQLTNKLKIPKKNSIGQSISYFLLSKTQGESMDEESTLRENHVLENEVFSFLYCC